MILGAILVSIGLEIFLIPNNIIDGGMTGISIMASYLTKVQLGIFIFIFNLPFVIIGYKQIGKTFALSTIFSVICLSINVTLFHSIPSITQDILLATIFGGITMGVGVGLIIRNGGSLDGTEIIAIILDKKSAFSIGEIVMFFNLFILGISGFIFGWDRAMYSLIAYFIAFKTIDIIVQGLDESKAVIIVSENNEKISEAIMARLGRGVTLFYGKGAYSGNKTNVIYVVLSRLEIAKLKNIVHGFDEDALITITGVEGTGKRYGKKAIH
ncbi:MULTISPECIES: YitT family protein [Clostridium]|uniref:YitT family protein n=1 Tax=Clostridium TaxID=1485 RepID=UPI00031AB793|nr:MULTISPECIES: YitT family protein [Clostridium]MBN1045148.1 YitT family protein [Clostridium botulinum]MBN1051870.1 YitT family protein [Clostridium botulinum]MBN1055088.1 YitT family protein [Clostridium botulinum]NFN93370.1 YitT family protein [Clostridium botulinum]NFS29309.1 YitT family protein [Clostridium botulinum]